MMNGYIILLLLVMPINGLNIVLSTTDSWVTKNIRLLYNDLISLNHNVLLVGPLYQSTPDVDVLDIGIDATNDGNHQDYMKNDLTDGGDFAHLLPSNQMFYKNLQKLPKNIIPSYKLKQRNLASAEIKTLNNSIQFGNDPLNNNNWYINSKNPLHILSIFLDNLLPTYYPHFDPDLVIMGPIEGSHYHNHDIINNINKFLAYKDIPSIVVNTMDNNHIYYNDEILTKKNNQFYKISSFINGKIIELIDRLAQNKHDEKLLPDNHSINLTFPKYFNSKCFHNINSISNLQFLNYNQLFNLSYSTFNLQQTKIIFEKTEMVKLFKRQDPFEMDIPSIEASEENDKLIYDESVKILANCNIPFSINYLYDLDSSYNYNYNLL